METHLKNKLMVGITGTNGETTVATILFNLFNKAGIKSGLISTINIKYSSFNIENHLTTPDSKKQSMRHSIKC